MGKLEFVAEVGQLGLEGFVGLNELLDLLEVVPIFRLHFAELLLALSASGL